MNNWLTEFEKLRTRIDEGEPQPDSLPVNLCLDDLSTCERVFQYRYDNYSASQAHIRELRKSLRAAVGKPFDAITIFWVGDTWCCIDGHHRLEAYKEEGFKEVIPVEVFTGSLELAFARASEGNSRDKLPMSRDEKLNAAWRLVIGTSLSKARISLASGVSERSVANMRTAKKTIEETYLDQDLGDLTWRDADRLSKGLEPLRGEFDEDWQEKKAQKMALSLQKHLGDQPRKQPELFARAIEIYSSNLANALGEWFGRDANGYDQDEENYRIYEEERASF